MASTFYGLEIGKAALNIQQQALNVTAHNVANASTPGYTRQQVINQAIEPPIILGMGSVYGRWQVGGGAEIQEIRQLRDIYLDKQFRLENESLGNWEVRRDTLQYLEGVFNEPSETGITTVLDQFFASLEELSKNPESVNVRALVRERAITLTDTINHIYTQLEDMQSQANEGVRLTVEDINSRIDQIVDLNKQIFKYELSGTKANDLRDRRNLLVDELSKMVNVTAEEDSDGHFKVMMDGEVLIDHFDAYKLKVQPRSEKLNAYDIDGLYDVIWERDPDKEINISGGQLKGYIDMRDGIGPSASDDQNPSVGVPYYMLKWNEFAKTFVSKFNEQHKEGYGLDGNKGYNFFEPIEDPTSWTAKDILISSDIENSLDHIAASDKADESGNNQNVLALLNLRYNTDVFSDVGSFEDYVNSLISTLGVDSQQAGRMVDNETSLVQQIDSKRQSISGVSLDEELTNMVKFQQSYNAAARIVTTMDELLDVLVNRMGVVGR